jgi:hypothetical protein
MPETERQSADRLAASPNAVATKSLHLFMRANCYRARLCIYFLYYFNISMIFLEAVPSPYN